MVIFGPNLHKKEVSTGHTQNNQKFFAEMTKAHHKLSKTFYFIKISYFDWVMNVFLFCGHFHLFWSLILNENRQPSRCTNYSSNDYIHTQGYELSHHIHVIFIFEFLQIWPTEKALFPWDLTLQKNQYLKS